MSSSGDFVEIYQGESHPHPNDYFESNIHTNDRKTWISINGKEWRESNHPYNNLGKLQNLLKSCETFEEFSYIIKTYDTH